MMEQRPLKLAMAAGCLLMGVVMYLVVGVSVGGSAKQMIPPWHTVASLVALFAALLVGGFYVPEKRRKLVFGLSSIVTFLLFVGAMLFRLGIDTLARWFVPAMAVSAVVIVLVALLWPTSNTSSTT
jgi:CHASE2 domain-containing sensor protein